MQISTETHKMRFHKDDKEMQNTQKDRNMQNDYRGAQNEMQTSSETHKVTTQHNNREQLDRA